jgi:hypothetical protein
MKSRLLLDVVVRESATILKLLSGEDKTLLIGGNAFLVLNLGLDVVNGVGGLNLESNGLAGEGLDENLHGLFLLVSKVLVDKKGFLDETIGK